MNLLAKFNALLKESNVTVYQDLGLHLTLITYCGLRGLKKEFDVCNGSSLNTFCWSKIAAAYNSHCSHHSTESVDFSLTEVWYFSLARAIVTKQSLVPFLPLRIKPLARFTRSEMLTYRY